MQRGLRRWSQPRQAARSSARQTAEQQEATELDRLPVRSELLRLRQTVLRIRSRGRLCMNTELAKPEWRAVRIPAPMAPPRHGGKSLGPRVALVALASQAQTFPAAVSTAPGWCPLSRAGRPDRMMGAPATGTQTCCYRPGGLAAAQAIPASVGAEAMAVPAQAAAAAVAALLAASVGAVEMASC